VSCNRIFGSPHPEARIDPLDRLREALKDRYAFERELGRGGMATVYLARDLRHDRPVALKVLHAELAASLGPERFLREIKLAARLQHPHILTVYDSGDAGGLLLWFTMPYVEGESLRDRLRRERQLPVADAVRLTREAALALDFAHRHGAVHRDIKPENILLVDGQALVADFGIARALGGGDDRLTETGMSIGTPAYMSPEQAAADKAVDSRSDIYSLGIVLYEMLAGETPFAAPTAQAMIARRMLEAPRPLREVRETVPDGVAQAVARALAKAPADRFATAAEFARALEQPAAGTAPTIPQTAAAPGSAPEPERLRKPRIAATALVLGFLIGLGVLFAWRRTHTGDDAGGSRLVAVLPFENLGDSSDEYFADGVTDAVRGKLSRIPGLEVIAGASSAEYKKTDKPLPQIARELGVGYLVVAKIRWAKAGDRTSRVQVSPELVQIASGRPTTKWQQPLDASLTDVFQVQADIAERVVQELGVALADSTRQQLAEQPTANLAAYDLFLKGEAASLGSGRTDPTSLREGIALYQQAVTIDPEFTLAWAHLSRANTFLYVNSVAARAVAESARAAADRAVTLEPKLAAAHVALGFYFSAIPRDNERAAGHYAEAQRLAPREASTLVAISAIEQNRGRHEAAIRALREAQRLDPRSPAMARRLGSVLGALRRYDEADSALVRGIQLSPNNLSMVHTRALYQLARGDLEGARRTIRTDGAGIDPKRLAIYVATYNDLHWVLTPEQQSLVLEGRPADFDGDVGSWGLALAQIYAAHGDARRARAYADSARAGFAAQIAEAPDDGQTRALHGLSLAYLGRAAEAVREGERGVELLPIARSSQTGTYIQELLARIYVMAGQPDKALDQLEGLLAHPAVLSPGWLRIDPSFAPLRDHPRFKQLIQGQGFQKPIADHP
jgi:eukaryotic-like serine/threonine-protein kinase